LGGSGPILGVLPKIVRFLEMRVKTRTQNGTFLGDFGWISGETIPEVPDIILAF
jgi:hypothetical protein